MNTLEELPPMLHQQALLIEKEDKVASGATFEDPELLAKYARLRLIYEKRVRLQRVRARGDGVAVSSNECRDED